MCERVYSYEYIVEVGCRDKIFNLLFKSHAFIKVIHILSDIPYCVIKNVNYIIRGKHLSWRGKSWRYAI